MGFIVSINKSMLDHIFGKATYVPPTSFYVGVSSTLPSANGGNITEPTDPAYVRKLTTTADWDAATSSDPATSVNNSDIVFAPASEDWFAGAEILYVVLFTANSGGTMIAFGSFARGKAIYDLDSFTIGAGKLNVSLA
jgi:hypothetical protein